MSGIVCDFTTGYLDLIDSNYTTVVRCCTTYDTSMYLYIPVIHFCCCCCSVCCYPAVAAAAALLLAAAVRHRVPDDAICSCGLLPPIPVFSFSAFEHVLFLMYPLAVLPHVEPRFTYNPTNNTYTSSKITDVRGAKAGGSPPRRSLPCMCYL